MKFGKIILFISILSAQVVLGVTLWVENGLRDNAMVVRVTYGSQGKGQYFEDAVLSPKQVKKFSSGLHALNTIYWGVGAKLQWESDIIKSSRIELLSQDIELGYENSPQQYFKEPFAPYDGTPIDLKTMMNK